MTLIYIIFQWYTDGQASEPARARELWSFKDAMIIAMMHGWVRAVRRAGFKSLPAWVSACESARPARGPGRRSVSAAAETALQRHSVSIQVSASESLASANGNYLITFCIYSNYLKPRNYLTIICQLHLELWYPMIWYVDIWYHSLSYDIICPLMI